MRLTSINILTVQAHSNVQKMKIGPVLYTYIYVCLYTYVNNLMWEVPLVSLSRVLNLGC